MPRLRQNAAAYLPPASCSAINARQCNTLELSAIAGPPEKMEDTLPQPNCPEQHVAQRTVPPNRSRDAELTEIPSRRARPDGQAASIWQAAQQLLRTNPVQALSDQGPLVTRAQGSVSRFPVTNGFMFHSEKFG